MSEERKHAKFSPSKFPQWEKCACFESGPVGPAAKKGTFEHDVLENLFLQNPVGKVDDVVFEKVQWAYEEILSIARECDAGIFDLCIEEKVSVMDDEMNEVTFGYLDVAFKDRIVDYKSGEIRSYWGQMAVYALAKMQAKGLERVQAIEVYGKYKETVPYWIERKVAEDYVKGIIERVNDENKKPVKNDYCGWCLKKAGCEEWTGKVKTVLKSVGVTTKEMSVLAKKSLLDLTPADMSLLMPLADAVAKWSKNVKDFVKGEMLTGTQVPGYYVKKAPGNPKITDTAMAMELSGLKKDQFISCCTASLPALAKMIQTVEGGKAKEARLVIENRLAKVIETGEDKISIVASDENKP